MTSIRDRAAKFSTILAGIALAMMMSQAAFGQVGPSPGQVEDQKLRAAGVGPSPGQREGPRAGAVEPAIFETQLTVRSHQITAGSSAGNLEGTSCPADYKMLSGACHPFYNDQVSIINQFPNIPLNTWRCGFENNTSATVTVWIYTLCGR